jgi:5-bromo-4-chloroindolyl phosphate hydrolysis protein
MQLKHIVLILIAVAYTGYYVGVSKGLINKEAQYGNEDEERTTVQKVVHAITPDSPEEKRLKNKDELDELYFQLDLAKNNYQSYVEWRTDAVNNPPT